MTSVGTEAAASATVAASTTAVLRNLSNMTRLLVDASVQYDCFVHLI
jgi:hypothetical protein